MKLKKTMQISICGIIFSMLLICLTGCSNNSEDLNAKATDEIEYLSTKFIALSNRLNNIIFENYKLTTGKITLTKESAEQEKTSSSSQSSGGQSGGNNQNSGTGENENSNSIISYQMSPNTILNPTTDTIDWAGLKNEIENVYYAWNTILLDLHQLGISNDEIYGFSSALDKVTTYIKNEDKLNTLIAIADLYSYLPKYLEIISQDNVKKNIIKTKSFILNAYSLVETNDWDSVREEITKADEAFHQVTTDINFVTSNSYQINKTYVLINELKNSLGLEDKDIFYIKYRNLLEEINNF